jgi:uncharacterized protein YggU (UPF0235/DUF167 family)
MTMTITTNMTVNVTVEVRIHTGSSQRGIQCKDGSLHLFTPKKPEHGRANVDAIEILSEYYNVPKSSISILRGEKSRNKVFTIKKMKK